MSEALTADGIGQSAGRLVEIDDHLPRHHAVAEGDHPRALLQNHVDHEAGGEAGVDGADVADHVPDRRGARPERKFLVN